MTTLLQLKSFVAVVDQGGFTAASRRLGLSQPAVSRAIATLEKELGLPLLVRGRDGTSLTEAGALALTHAREALRHLIDRRARPVASARRRSRRRRSTTACAVGDRVYAIGARELPAENAVLAVVRDRTDELRRELAEREFVSNAAHELRNPIAGISGAIEVLRAGAKDDPAAREHFLGRLSDDAERVSRLTDSLLTLARMEAVGEGRTEALDVALVIEEAAQAVAPPDGLEVKLELEPDLAARSATRCCCARC